MSVQVSGSPADDIVQVQPQLFSYHYDLHLLGSVGWRRLETEVDSEKFGIWLHPGDGRIFQFCDGQRSLFMTDSEFEFDDEVARLEHLHPRRRTSAAGDAVRAAFAVLEESSPTPRGLVFG